MHFTRLAVIVPFIVLLKGAFAGRKGRERDSGMKYMLKHYGATSKEEYHEMVKKAMAVKKYISKNILGEKFDKDLKKNQQPVLGDIILDVNMSIRLLKEMKQKRHKLRKEHKKVTRTKRSLFLDFANPDTKRDLKWEQRFPFQAIRYEISPSMSGPGRENLRYAIHEIEKKTCIRFNNVKETGEENSQIIFANEAKKGCSSCIGHIYKNKPLRLPQPIYLEEPGCNLVGIAIHEILHALGADHEHRRPDRDEHITILGRHIKPDQKGNFFPERTNGDVMNSPYDYSSVMHYEARGGFGIGGTTTILTKDRNFLGSLGQRADMSFFDAKAVAKAYCIECGSECYHGGYRYIEALIDKCSDCHCPDGIIGKICQTVNSVGSPGCTPQSGQHVADSDYIRCLTSPNYGNGGYKSGESCNWYIKAKNHRCRVSMYFKGDFEIYCRSQVICEHWVEVKVDRLIRKPGFRFCCGNPQVPTGGDIISEGPRAVVTFRALQIVQGRFNGFQLCYYQICGKATG